MHTPPELLAVRAVNQCRRRDVIAYLGLRTYLANPCAQRNRWAIEVACRLAQEESHPLYHDSWHFKERTEDNGFE